MPPSMTIGELAASAGVKISTVRYYERRGLLPADGRTDGNYRSYASASLQRLSFIRTAQRIGFTLADIATLLDLQSGSSDPCCDVKTIIDQRLVAVREKLAELAHVEQVLGKAAAWCEKSAGTGRCAALDELGTSFARPHPGLP